MKALVNLLFFVCIACSTKIVAQTNIQHIPNIAVLSPLFLDSAFGEKGYRHGKLVAPFATAGVEYYFGAKKAMDSLNKENVYCNFYVFDSKSIVKPIATLIANNELAKMDMIIGSASGIEVKELAEYAKKLNIPFINATFPNDASVTNNPNFVILNSTLGTIAEKLHGFVADKIKDQRILFLTKEGRQEERILGYFKKFDSIKSYTGINYINLGKDVKDENINTLLDENVLTTLIVGSNDVLFARTIAKAVAKKKMKEQTYLLGLATWDSYNEFNHKDYEGQDFYFVAPLVNQPLPFATQLASQFTAKYGSNPSDNVFRGFETIYKYANLIAKYGKDSVLKNPAMYEFNTLHYYDIKPVSLNGDNTIDYFENKKVYVIKRYNGKKTTLGY